MRLLLDTQVFLWMLSGAVELSPRARKHVVNADNNLYLSLASVWEIAIKSSIGKLRIDEPIETFLPTQMRANDIDQLDISFRHVARVASLPFHHRDPFDRLLACQALEEKLALISADPIFDRYKIPRVW